MTFDNGTEFARQYDLRTRGIDTYFCDTHAPWQKGWIENAIRRMRRFVPRKTDLATIDHDILRAMLAAYNNTATNCLGWKAPAEAFNDHMLHFKRELTLPRKPSRGSTPNQARGFTSWSRRAKCLQSGRRLRSLVGVHASKTAWNESGD